MRRLLTSVAVAATLVVGSAGAQEKLVIAVVPKNLNNPFFDQAKLGCEKAVAEIGADKVECFFTGPPEHGGGDEQVQIVAVTLFLMLQFIWLIFRGNLGTLRMLAEGANRFSQGDHAVRIEPFAHSDGINPALIIEHYAPFGQFQFQRIARGAVCGEQFPRIPQV